MPTSVGSVNSWQKTDRFVVEKHSVLQEKDDINLAMYAIPFGKFVAPNLVGRLHIDGSEGWNQCVAEWLVVENIPMDWHWRSWITLARELVTANISVALPFRVMGIEIAQQDNYRFCMLRYNCIDRFREILEKFSKENRRMLDNAGTLVEELKVTLSLIRPDHFDSRRENLVTTSWRQNQMCNSYSSKSGKWHLPS